MQNVNTFAVVNVDEISENNWTEHRTFLFFSKNDAILESKACQHIWNKFNHQTVIDSNEQRRRSSSALSSIFHDTAEFIKFVLFH